MSAILSFLHRRKPIAIAAKRGHAQSAEGVTNRAAGRTALDAFLQGRPWPSPLPKAWSFLRYVHPSSDRETLRLTPHLRGQFMVAGGTSDRWPTVDILAFYRYVQACEAAQLERRARKALDAWAVALCDGGTERISDVASERRVRLLWETVSLLMASPPECRAPRARLQALLPVLLGQSKALPALVYHGDVIDRLITAALVPRLPYNVSLPPQVAKQLGLWLPSSVRADRAITLLYMARRHGVCLPHALRMDACPPTDAAALRGLFMRLTPSERAHYSQTELFAPALCALPSH